MVSVSSDGGNTWTTKKVTEAASNAQHGFRQGTTIRTDSNGVVYLFFARFGPDTPGIGTHAMVKSYDGGHTWTRPQDIVSMNDACYNIDPVIGPLRGGWHCWRAQFPRGCSKRGHCKRRTDRRGRDQQDRCYVCRWPPW